MKNNEYKACLAVNIARRYANEDITIKGIACELSKVSKTTPANVLSYLYRVIFFGLVDEDTISKIYEKQKGNPTFIDKYNQIFVDKLLYIGNVSSLYTITEYFSIIDMLKKARSNFSVENFERVIYLSNKLEMLKDVLKSSYDVIWDEKLLTLKKKLEVEVHKIERKYYLY